MKTKKIFLAIALIAGLSVATSKEEKCASILDQMSREFTGDWKKFVHVWNTSNLDEHWRNKGCSECAQIIKERLDAHTLEGCMVRNGCMITQDSISSSESNSSDQKVIAEKRQQLCLAYLKFFDTNEQNQRTCQDKFLLSLFDAAIYYYKISKDQEGLKILYGIMDYEKYQLTPFRKNLIEECMIKDLILTTQSTPILPDLIRFAIKKTTIEKRDCHTECCNHIIKMLHNYSETVSEESASKVLRFAEAVEKVKQEALQIHFLYWFIEWLVTLSYQSIIQLDANEFLSKK